MFVCLNVYMMKDCVFCKIINKEEPTDIIYEDSNVIVIKDIKSRAPIHLLIIPKKHIISVNHLEDEDKALVGDLILTAKKMAQEKKLNDYKLLINIGKQAGQVIDHLHLHLLSGKPR